VLFLLASVAVAEVVFVVLGLLHSFHGVLAVAVVMIYVTAVLMLAANLKYDKVPAWLFVPCPLVAAVGTISGVISFLAPPANGSLFLAGVCAGVIFWIIVLLAGGD